MSLDNIKLGHSTLTDSIFLYRHGKDQGLALEKREAESDVFCVLVEYMMYNSPKGSIKKVTIDGKPYTVKVTPGH